MQNKGFVKFIAVLLTLICLFYFSFSYVTNKYHSEAEQIEATKGKDAARAFLEQKRSEKVYLGWKTLADCEKLQIGLGLDLKGGVSFLLEVSVPDMVNTYAGEKANDAEFKALLKEAKEEATRTGGDFVEIFFSKYQAKHGQNQLGAVFAEKMGNDGISYQSSDADVKKALDEKISGAVENAYEVITSRIDQYGVAQPNIQILKGKGQLGQIMVEMPGVTDPDDVQQLLTGSANLEFWTTYQANEVANELNEIRNLTIHVKTTNPKTKKEELVNKKLGDVLSPQGAGGCVVGMVVNKADVTAVENALKSDSAQAILKNCRFAFSAKAEKMGQGSAYLLYALKGERNNSGELQPSLSGDVIDDAKPDYDSQHGGRPVVSMTMKTDAARQWAEITGQNVGKPIAIVLDGRVYSAPAPSEKIAGGSSQISGSFTPDDTRALAIVLKSGKMSVPLVVVQTETVGPSLGEASIQAGFTACIVALILLGLFMCLYYGFIGGMVANCALLLNFFFTFGILTSFQAALTMSGIAGMVLSLGMAVDANVLIYERIKEELRAGKNIKSALADGYGNAFSAIFDSNLTSIITAVILYYFGTGAIRGFALTLGIGIVASFFTAVWLTRICYEHFLNKDKWQHLTFVTRLSRGLFVDTKVGFMKMGRKSIIVFGVLTLIFIGLMVGRGLSKGIEFTGGRNYVIQFEKHVEPEDVKAAVASVVEKSDEPNASVSAIKVVTAESECIRLTTNYKINDDDEVVDQFVWKALSDAKLITADYKTFKDRENRAGGSIVSSQKVGSSVAEDMTKGAIISVILSLVAIFLYILVRFRNVAFSVGSVAALTIDTLFIIGMYALCWGWVPFSLEVDQTFIAAVLTAIGYSINDKVVVFDRIREYLRLYPKRNTHRLFNDALNHTLSRTIMTSSTTFLVLLCIFFLGGDSIRSFAFAMILGVVFGTLSSIFLAAPIAYRVLGKKRIIGDENEEPVKA